MRKRGFTLIELMVSIALFGLIASGAMMLVMSGLRMQSHSARVDVAQSALRAGLDFMTRDILSASAGMTSGSIMLVGSTTATNTVGLTNSSTVPDMLDLYMADSNYDFASAYTTVGPTSPTITVSQIAPFSKTQTLVITDLINAASFNISAIAAGTPPQGTLTVSSMSSFPTGIAGYTPPYAYVFVLRHVRYSIGPCFAGATNNATYSNQSCLMMDLFDGTDPNSPNFPSNPQPLAEGVEDLQVALGFDNNGDGAIQEDPSTSDEWYGNVAGDIQPATQANLKVVRITIIAISTLNENVKFGTGGRPKAEDHAAGPSDGFFRRTIRSEVTVRNFNI
jgi:prepilin-type N-terminal cleavage/methylation domain-containing protein